MLLFPLRFDWHEHGAYGLTTLVVENYGIILPLSIVDNIYIITTHACRIDCGEVAISRGEEEMDFSCKIPSSEKKDRQSLCHCERA